MRLYDSGKPAEAAQALAGCQSLFGEDERDSVEYADFCGNYGAALAEAGELKAAEWMLNAALLIYHANGATSDAARTHFNLGNVYRYMNSRQPCSDNYRAALDAYRKSDEPAAAAQCLLSLANAYFGWGIPELAQEWLDEFEQLDDSVKRDPLTRWSWLFQRAKIALGRGDSATALDCLENALACTDQIADLSYRAETETAIARLQAELGELQTDDELEAQLVATTTRAGPSEVRETLELARAWRDRDAFERAEPLYRRCLDLIDRTRGELDGAERYHLMETAATVAQEFSRELVARKRAGEALAASERGQGRALLDLMFRHQIKMQGGRTIRATGGGRIVLDAPGWDEIRALLREEQLHLLKILITPAETVVWFSEPDGRVDAWLVSEADGPLDDALGLLLWSEPDGGTEPTGQRDIAPASPDESPSWELVDAALDRLYRAVLPEPVRQRLERAAGSLLVVPHGAYFHLPWSALGPSGGAPLGARWEIAVAASVGVFMQLDGRRDVPQNQQRLPAIAFGGVGERTVDVPVLPFPDIPHQRMHFADLPWTEPEVQRVSARTGGIAVVHEHVTRRAVLLSLNGAPIIHLASHGYWNRVSGELSFVLLAPDETEPGDTGLLLGAEIMDYVCSAELVVLSGCQTGLGSSHPDSYVSLAHSFLVAGARSVLVSLWPIGDDATRAFFDSFYRNLADQRLSPAASLRATEEEFRDLLDPWDWSGFSVIGHAFRSMAGGEDVTSTQGPAFCGGDVLWLDARVGDVLDLSQYTDRCQTRTEGWLVKGSHIVTLPKH